MRRSKSPPVSLSKKPKKLPSRPGAFLPSKLGSKLSIAHKDYVLSLLSQGHKPVRIREILVKEQGIAISDVSIRGYLKTHKDEIAKRRELWNKDIEITPLRYRRTRLEELVRLYSLTLREFYRMPCTPCKGSSCKKCKGMGWALPKEIVAYEIGENVESDVLRLSQTTPPERWSSQAWDRALACLREIREEVGDGVEQKRRGNVDETEAFARAAAMLSFKQRIDNLTSTEFIGLLREMASQRQKGEL